MTMTEVVAALNQADTALTNLDVENDAAASAIDAARSAINSARSTLRPLIDAEG